MKTLLIRKEPGFTFMEVALSLVLIGSILSSLFLLQNTLLEGVSYFSQRFDRILILNKTLNDKAFIRLKDGMSFESLKKVTTQIDVPEAVLNYEIVSPLKESALYRYKDIVIEKITAQWPYWYGTRQEQIVTLLYRPEKQQS